jgi:hypothetical protein
MFTLKLLFNEGISLVTNKWCNIIKDIYIIKYTRVIIATIVCIFLTFQALPFDASSVSGEGFRMWFVPFPLGGPPLFLGFVCLPRLGSFLHVPFSPLLLHVFI